MIDIKEITNKIHYGNNLDVIKNFPDNFIDMGVTSPPYNKNESQKKPQKSWLVTNVRYDCSDNLWKDDYQNQQICILNELYRVIKPGGSFFYNHKLRWMAGIMIHPMEWLKKTKWFVRQEIIWNRFLAANLRGWRFWQVEERIYWLYKPEGDNFIGKELKSKHALLTSIWSMFPERNISDHPAPFPIQLPTRCIYSILDDSKNGIVIDPYSGSGTTLVSAKYLGHNYIGIDISKTYIDLAQKRLATIDEKDSFSIVKEMNKHVVVKSSKQRKSSSKNGVLDQSELASDDIGEKSKEFFDV